MAYLILKTGEEQGRLFYLTEDVTTLGRNGTNNIVIADMAASRFHARIVRRDNWLFLQDLHSTHGIFVNNERITEEVFLRDKDRIQIGNTGLLFRAKDTPDSEPEPSVPATLRYASTPPEAAPKTEPAASDVAPTDRNLPPVDKSNAG